MRQHHKKISSSVKGKRQWVRSRGLELLEQMDISKPVTKKKRRLAFAECRKQAKRERHNAK